MYSPSGTGGQGVRRTLPPVETAVQTQQNISGVKHKLLRLRRQEAADPAVQHLRSSQFGQSVSKGSRGRELGRVDSARGR